MADVRDENVVRGREGISVRVIAVDGRSGMNHMAKDVGEPLPATRATQGDWAGKIGYDLV